MMATVRAERNYKALSSELKTRGSRARSARATLAPASDTPVLILRRQGAVNTGRKGRPPTRMTPYGSVKSPRRTRSVRSVEHGESAREVLIATADGPCKSSSSDAPFGCLAVPSCLHHPALASPLTARAMEEGMGDARPPADGCCNGALTEPCPRDALETSPTAYWNRPPHAG